LPRIRQTWSKAFYETLQLPELLLTMSPTQPIDTNNAYDTDDQITQREIPTATPTKSLPAQIFSTQNDEKLKPPKILQGTSIPKQVKQCTNKQNKDIVIDGNNILEQERQALLADKSISFNFEVTELGPPNSENDMTLITNNTKQHMMDTDAASNATIESTKVPHQLYSSVLSGKDQTNNNMMTESSMHWPNMVRTRVANKSIDLKEDELDATKWNYNTILQAFSNIPANCTELEAHKNSASMGAAIAVRNSVQPYIQNVQSISAILVMIDLALPRNTGIRVISIYLPSNNQKLLLKAQHEIIE
ncbi:38899_t:CDS:2, partial [Gigaspora margarita]